MSEGLFKTDDLALAAIFVCEGFEDYYLELIKEHKVIWVFEFDPRMDAIAGAYTRKAHYVEPKTYARAFNILRREAQGFLRETVR